MDLRDLSTEDLIQSLEAETAKSLSEVKHLLGDLEKIKSRLAFLMAVLHIVKERKD